MSGSHSVTLKCNIYRNRRFCFDISNTERSTESLQYVEQQCSRNIWLSSELDFSPLAMGSARVLGQTRWQHCSTTTDWWWGVTHLNGALTPIGCPVPLPAGFKQQQIECDRLELFTDCLPAFPVWISLLFSAGFIPDSHVKEKKI